MYLNRKEEFKKMMRIINLLESNLNDIKVMIENDESKCMKLIKIIEKEIKKNKESIKELNNPFLLSVIGNGNYGKSTVINSLLGEKVIKTSDFPNTWKLDLFTKSNKEKMEIFYNNTSIVRDIENGNKILLEEEEKYKKSKQKIQNLLTESKNKKNVNINELKEYKKVLENKYLYKSDISQVKYHLRNGDILEDFIIVDTPGLNQTLLSDTVNRVQEYYIRSDGVIILIDAQNLASKSSNRLLDEIDKIESISNTSKNKIIVINKMDIIRNIDTNNIIKVKKKAYEIYKYKCKDIVFISAKEALKGILTNNNILVDSSNINQLYKSIEENFKAISQENQIKSKYNNLELMKHKIINNIHSYKRELYKDISIYNEIDYDIVKKLDDIYAYVYEYINDIKGKQYNSKEDLDKIKESIIKLEELCSIKLSKLYESIYIKSNFNQNNFKDKINPKIYLSKSKNLIFNKNVEEDIIKKNNNQIADILYKLTSKKLDYNSYDDCINQIMIHDNLNNLSEEIQKIIDNKFKEIQLNINGIKNDNFKNKYIRYKNIQKHIDCLNNMENILTNLG